VSPGWKALMQQPSTAMDHLTYHLSHLNHLSHYRLPTTIDHNQPAAAPSTDIRRPLDARHPVHWTPMAPTTEAVPLGGQLPRTHFPEMITTEIAHFLPTCLQRGDDTSA